MAFDFPMPLLDLALSKRADKITALKNKNGFKKIYGSWVGRPVGLNRMSQGLSDRTLCTCTPMPVANEPCLFAGTPTPDAEK